MKKLLVVVLVLGMVFMGAVAAYADETEFESNMTSDIYLETRLAQIETARINGLITDEQAELLVAHVNEVALEGTYGNGPTFGVKGDGNAECILGENDLGIFRSTSAGRRMGSGNGVSQKLSDGSGHGRRSQGNGGVCIIE